MAVAEIVEVWQSSRSSAACRAAAGALKGVTPVEMAEVASWQSFLSQLKEPDLAAAVLEKALSTRSYLVGNRLTLADVVAYLVVDVASLRGTAGKRWLATVQREVRRLAPDAKLPPLVELPANLDGPLPLPKKKSAPATKKAGEEKQPAATKKDKKKKQPPAEKKKEPAASAKKKEPEEESSAAEIFATMDIRVGVVVDAWPHAEAEKLFCEKIDVGDEEKPRTIASGLRAHYDVGDIKDRKVLVFANLKPRTMSGFKSEGMVLCASTADHSVVKFLEVPDDAPPGTRVSLEGVDNKPPATGSQVQKRKLLEKLLPALRTDPSGVATCDGKTILLPQGPVRAPLNDAAIG